MNCNIRPETSADHQAIRHVNRLAFGQDAEASLVDALRDGGHVRLALVAEHAGRVVGHILFSDLPIVTGSGTVPALALAPLAVLPEFQNRGIGSALVRSGLDECRRQGHKIVVVLGHPHFYPRFGFSPKLAGHLESPFSGQDSFMALELVAGALAGVAGRVQYAPPFDGVVRGTAAGRSNPSRQLTLLLLEGAFTVCRLAGGASIPPWATAGPFFSITGTADELSVVGRQDAVPEGVVCERGWRCLRVAGTIPFSAVGVLAALTAPLAEAGVSLFAVSTFDTDYLLVKENDLTAALDALRRHGHAVR
jgi:putative acetyltransferase